jgi:hypothetical protein
MSNKRKQVLQFIQSGFLQLCRHTDYSSNSLLMSSLEFGHVCSSSHMAFCGFLEIMILISDITGPVIEVSSF